MRGDCSNPGMARASAGVFLACLVLFACRVVEGTGVFWLVPAMAGLIHAKTLLSRNNNVYAIKSIHMDVKYFSA